MVVYPTNPTHRTDSAVVSWFSQWHMYPKCARWGCEQACQSHNEACILSDPAGCRRLSLHSLCQEVGTAECFACVGLAWASVCIGSCAAEHLRVFSRTHLKGSLLSVVLLCCVWCDMTCFAHTGVQSLRQCIQP